MMRSHAESHLNYYITGNRVSLKYLMRLATLSSELIFDSESKETI